MRGLDAHRAAGARQAVEFLHGRDHVVHVLDHMDRQHAVEAVIAERIRGAVAVDADGAGPLVDAAADIQRFYTSWIAIFRHSSSTSTAKAAWSRVITSGGHSRIEFSPAPSTSRPRSNASSS